MNKTLAVLVPYRNRLDQLQCFADNICHVDRTCIEFILIAMGDDDPEAADICRNAKIRYHFENDTGVFRIGKAHNIGAALSPADYILKMDVDLLAPPGVYEGIIRHINRNMKSPSDFLVMGCYFAGKEFSENHLQSGITIEHITLLKETTAFRDKHLLQQPEGTMFLMNRKFYLGFGGCSEAFSGHGWEDYQVIYFAEKIRNPGLSLMDFAPNTIRTRLVLPANKKATALGFTFIHKWHPPVADPQYYAGRGGNTTLLRQLLEQFDPQNIQVPDA